ncbi:MAG: hypothetical protein WCC60_23715, partial [Ilumatobacteraceae bacterium]
MTDHSMQRRAVLKAGLGAIALLGLPACTSDDEAASDPAADPTTADPTTDPTTDPTANEPTTAGTIPAPTGMVRTSWSTDPFTLGSYSYLP